MFWKKNILILLCAAVLLSPDAPGQDAAGDAATPDPQPVQMPLREAVSEVAATVEKGVEHLAENSLQDPAQRGQISGFLAQDIFGFSVGRLVLAFFILLGVLVLRGIVVYLLFSRLRRLAEKTRTDLDVRMLVVLERPVGAFFVLLALYLATLVLPIEPRIGAFIDSIFRGASMLVGMWLAIRFVDFFMELFGRTLQGKKDSALLGFLPLIKRTLKVFVLIVGVLMAVANLGYNVTGLIATLGLGTAAIALASQDTIRNGFGALMIMLDRPFKVGDWIQIGDKVDGDVESIGLRSTKVRTWPKTLLSIPNGVLANEYINNWSCMPKRRVRQILGVTYSATSKDMTGIVEDIRQIMREDEGVEQEFILVNFIDFGESALEILVYYFTKTIAWKEHMDVRQRINCKIMDAVAARGLSIAFPTRTLHFEGDVARNMAAGGGLNPSGTGNPLPGDFGPQLPP